MSALPDEHHRPRTAGQPSKLLADSLRDAARVRHEAQLRGERLQARIEGGEHFEYAWETPDGRDADLRIHYRKAESVELLGVELLRIDYRRPTRAERLHYEECFESLWHEAGELWLHVTSHIWAS